MSLNVVKINKYNLPLTLFSGQTFAWEYNEPYFYGSTVDGVIKLKVDKDKLYWQTYPQKDNKSLVEKYLNLKFPYEEMLSKISKDIHIKQAILQSHGLRLLQQNTEEMILSFILSSHKNIKSIKNSIELLRFKYGNKVTIDNKDFYTFPNSYVLSDANLNDLRSVKIGFRSNYLKEAATKLTDKQFLTRLHTLDENSARAELIKFKGIGNKIADCILVFGLGIYTTTPLDVWGQRVLTDLYKLDKKTKYEDMLLWIKDYYKEHTGWAGQFLFEYMRTRYS